MNEIDVKEFKIKARRLWQSLSNNQKITFLHYCADKTGDINRWDKMIPHPMSEFDIFFDAYSPSELDVILTSCVRKNANTPFCLDALYFVFDKQERKLTPVYKPEETLAVVFERMVREIGVEKISEYLSRAFPMYPSISGGLFWELQGKELENVKKWISENKTLVVSVALRAEEPVRIHVEGH